MLKKVNPAIVVAPHPHLDNHADHQYVTVALAEALERWKKPATFLLYTNHAARNLYPYGPAGTNVSIPPLSASLPGWAAGGELPVQGVYSHPVEPGPAAPEAVRAGDHARPAAVAGRAGVLRRPGAPRRPD